MEIVWTPIGDSGTDRLLSGTPQTSDIQGMNSWFTIQIARHGISVWRNPWDGNHSFLWQYFSDYVLLTISGWLLLVDRFWLKNSIIVYLWVIDFERWRWWWWWWAVKSRGVSVQRASRDRNWRAFRGALARKSARDRDGNSRYMTMMIMMEMIMIMI